MPSVEIKDYNELINNKPFINQPKTTNKHKENLSKCKKIVTTQ